MTQVAVTEATTTGTVQRRQKAKKPKKPKPTMRLVNRLQRGLDQKTEAYQLLNDSWNRVHDERATALNERDGARCDRDAFRREGDLARDQRDEARNERDASNRESANVRRQLTLEYTKHRQVEHELRGDLSRLRMAHAELSIRYAELHDLNQRNFDKAARYADVAAILFSCIIGETDEGPTKTLDRFAKVAMQMGVSGEIVDEIRTAFSRGSAARAKQAVDDAVAMAAEEPQPSTDDEDFMFGLPNKIHHW